MIRKKSLSVKSETREILLPRVRKRSYSLRVQKLGTMSKYTLPLTKQRAGRPTAYLQEARATLDCVQPLVTGVYSFFSRQFRSTVSVVLVFKLLLTHTSPGASGGTTQVLLPFPIRRSTWKPIDADWPAVRRRHPHTVLYQQQQVCVREDGPGHLLSLGGGGWHC